MILIRIAHQSDIMIGPFKGKIICEPWEFNIKLMDLYAPSEELKETTLFAFTLKQFAKVFDRKLLWDLKREGFVPYMIETEDYRLYSDQAIFKIHKSVYKKMPPHKHIGLLGIF